MLSVHIDQLYRTFLWNLIFSTFTSVFQSNFKINSFKKKQQNIFLSFIE